ncbi:MAG: molybdopterin oxidoreductase iron-sulfur binding subunit [Gammaproteobacteria bacterium]|nr:MAG: molybdopterin oxidoreductase iron-sulfur binding subunit [Gammaproteobacteria bacterium]TND06260.1 MAG: molybdopterin oxidoreductase, iron-sulfur binding subunit [Gammaproteobacteria bacterium]
MSLRNLLENWGDYRKGREQGGHHKYEHMWGMAIDLNLCIGCNACSVACYAENNLAVVGKEKFEKGHALHWMRVERYWDEPNLGEARVSEYQVHGASFVPTNCQNCNAATCEPVCPVAATYHTPDGLNAQVYNRCIGSRYCSNNCPYRLRYFNFWSYYESSWPAPLHMQLNPDLTVRDKGVMEKCTFCVQRIRAAKDKAKMENRVVAEGGVVNVGDQPFKVAPGRAKVQDMEFQTACQQTCPTSAISFGDMLNPDSQVSKLWRSHQVELGKTSQKKPNPELRGYRLLEELNTDPRVMFLERVREV